MKPNVVLITGGARGIGKGIALDLAAQGWAVAICYRTSAQDAKETTNAIQRLGGQALSVSCDVSDSQACYNLVKQVEEH